MEPLVSVIIPTYNRFRFLQNAIQSVIQQTYKNIEIIVINDRSTQPEYYNYNFTQLPNVIIVHLPKNSKAVVGHGCAAFVRNEGMKLAKGKYIAFLDDDDIWLPHKLTVQIAKMEATGRGMSCTDCYWGKGMYRPDGKYAKYNEEKHKSILQDIFKLTKYLKPDFPDVWTLDFLKTHNCCITSTVVVKRDLIAGVGYMALKRRGEDYDCWLKILAFTECDYLKDICAYYDDNHAEGINY